MTNLSLVPQSEEPTAQEAFNALEYRLQEIACIQHCIMAALEASSGIDGCEDGSRARNALRSSVRDLEALVDDVDRFSGKHLRGQLGS